MKFLIPLLLSLASAACNSQKLMECDLYIAQENTKQDQTIFRVGLSVDKSVVEYTLVSGKEWFLPSPSKLNVLWLSQDGLRAVTHWTAKDYGRDKGRWSPVYIVDLDFGTPNFRQDSYGGFGDFSQIISSPWKHECKRLN